MGWMAALRTKRSYELKHILLLIFKAHFVAKNSHCISVLKNSKKERGASKRKTTVAE
jgi:hypothetical protein